MISNITKNTAIGALSYAMEKDLAEVLKLHGLYGESAEDLAREMRAISDLRNIKNPVMHISLSLENGERASDEQWKLAADAHLIKMGFDLDKTQYALIRHTDSKHDHVHIIANRIQIDGSVINDSNTYKRSHEATRAAEIAAGLKVFEKGQEPSHKGKMHDLRSSIDNALASHKNYNEFKNALAQAGINIIENRSKTTGFLSGLSYELADSGQVWKGSAIGKAYSLNGLEKQGLETGRPTQHTAQSQIKSEAKSNIAKSQSQPKKSAAHDSSKATQARIDAEKARLHGHTNQAKASAQADENKRLKVLEHHKKLEQEEEYE